MSEPDWNPDTGGRSLAEILREAGIESAARTERRRRLDDLDDTGIRQRGSGNPPPDGRPSFGRRAADLRGGDRHTGPAGRPVEPSTAAIPGLRPSRKPGVPGAAGPAADPGGSTTGGFRTGGIPARDYATGEFATGGVPTGGGARNRSAGRAGASAAVRDRRAGAPGRDGDFSTGPIPVVRAQDVDPSSDLDATPRESALAWLRFAGELVIALAAGVGVYFAATVLWEMVPQVAVVLAPLAVTGLVSGVSYWRHRLGREPVGTRLLAVLVFAGTLLTIAPAAGLLAAG